MRDDGLGGDIVVADVVGHRLANPRNLTPRIDASPKIEPQYTPAWSPDSRHIGVASAIDADREVVVMTPDGSVVRRIRRPGADFYPAWLWSGSGQRETGSG